MHSSVPHPSEARKSGVMLYRIEADSLLRRVIHRARLENHAPSLSLRVFGAEVAVDFPDQNAAILVAHPSGNGQIIDASHDRCRNKIMPQIVKTESREVGGSSCQSQGFHKGFCRTVLFTATRRGEKPFRIRNGFSVIELTIVSRLKSCFNGFSFGFETRFFQ